MKKLIGTEDIRKGDLIRRERDNPPMGQAQAVEYVAGADQDPYIFDTNAFYYLLDRPKPPLPTEPGWYDSTMFSIEDGCKPYLLTEMGEWYLDGVKVTKESMGVVAPMYRLVREDS